MSSGYKAAWLPDGFSKGGNVVTYFAEVENRLDENKAFAALPDQFKGVDTVLPAFKVCLICLKRG